MKRRKLKGLTQKGQKSPKKLKITIALGFLVTFQVVLVAYFKFGKSDDLRENFVSPLDYFPIWNQKEDIKEETKEGTIETSQEYFVQRRPLQGIETSIEERSIEEISLRSPQNKKYLAYVPCDGFGNQILSLVHGFYFAWLTQRILIVPPILDHFEAPARGNCYDPSIPGFTNQNDIVQEYKKIYQKKVESGTYIPLTQVLNLTQMIDFVEYIDEQKFYSIMDENNIDIYQPPQDCCTCQDTIWLSSSVSMKPIKVGDTFAIPTSIEKTLTPRNETILQMGSIYIPSNAIVPFYSAFEKAFVNLLKASNSIPYVNTIRDFGRAVKSKIQSTRGYFTCVHLRITESYFKEAKDSSVLSVLYQLRKLPRKGDEKPTILLLTDAKGDEKQELLLNLTSEFHVKQIGEDFGEMMNVYKTELDFDLDILHFEVMACACAHSFVGNPISTFSKRISSLRKIGC